ncbi:MAG: FUSC family protein, partial [Fusobacteria bacterium]|nr:FUSC family protein [Fusobacteriota bacterium]
MKLSTKVGIQAAIGVLIAWYIMSLLPIPKSYWGPLTVIVLFASSKGQNQSRAIFRVTMTLFGGLFATLIVYYIHLPLIGNIIVLLIVTF